MKNTFLVLSLSALLITSCKLGGNSSSSTPAVTHIQSDAAFKTSAVLWQQTSAEYEALCLQAYAIAEDRIRNPQPIAADDGYVYESTVNDGGMNAIIMDLDETVFDNSLYHGYLILENREYSKETWNNWVNREEATLIPGAYNFIMTALELSIPIFYVSNRDFSTINATLNNLRKFNINVEEDQLLLKDVGMTDKLSRFEKVERQYNVVLYIGDNLNDYKVQTFGLPNISSRKASINEMRQHIGRDFILLPNPVYGDWEEALKVEDNKARQNAEKNATRYLKRFD